MQGKERTDRLIFTELMRGSLVQTEAIKVALKEPRPEWILMRHFNTCRRTRNVEEKGRQINGREER